MIKNNKLLAVLVVVGLAIGIGAFTVINNMLEVPGSDAIGETPVDSEEVEVVPEPPILKAALLTGEPCETQLLRRPLAVTIENSPNARPQSGLKEADVVYEVLAEGGITRFLAIYQQNDAENVGPIRSARDYLAHMAHDFDGVFVHIGGSPGGLAYVGQNSVANLNAFYIASGEFWRTSDRRAPHNLYSKTEEMRKLLVKQNYERDKELEVWPFLGPEEEVGGSIGEMLKIYYPSAISVVEYEYQPELDLYARTMGGRPHLDRESGLQLAARNIIVQFADTRVIDGEGRLRVDLVGKGKALVFTQGKVIEGSWAKSNKTSRTIYTDDSGEEIPLTPGQTWIQIVKTDTRLDY